MAAKVGDAGQPCENPSFTVGNFSDIISRNLSRETALNIFLMSKDTNARLYVFDDEINATANTYSIVEWKELSFRFVPPVLVLRRGLQHPLSSEAMGACLQILALADLKLSKFAASCADFWILGGFCACCNVSGCRKGGGVSSSVERKLRPSTQWSRTNLADDHPLLLFTVPLYEWGQSEKGQ
eukprot:scaffold17983_cov42-Cyclotella_meneghiniana.AAC.2